MTATLSPIEQDEVSRFGTHDDDVLRDLAEHIDDEVQCGAQDDAAVAIARHRCCEASVPICQGHIDQAKAMLTELAWVHCGGCELDLSGLTFDQAVELVTL